MRTFLLGCLTLCLAGWQGVARTHGQTWSEHLGFPPGAKVVVLDLRGAGVLWEANLAIQNVAIDYPQVSITAVPTGPWFENFARWSSEHSDLDVGVSIALTNPLDAPRWGLLTPRRGPTSLVDADGRPWKSAVQFALSATIQDVKAELDAQIEFARTSGIQPTHLTGYYGVVFSRADVAEVFVGAARKYWIPAPVVELTPELAEHFRREGFPVDDQMLELVTGYPLPKVDDLQISPVVESYEEKLAAFQDYFQSMQPGLTLLILRPAVESPGLKWTGPGWRQRVWDAEILADEAFWNSAAKAEIVFTNWREIMGRFEGRTPGESVESQTHAGE